MRGVVHSVNISSGGVPKYPVKGANIGANGVEGDFNWFRNEKREGDPDRAVCLFSLERIEERLREGHPIEVGSTGENITIRGGDWPSLESGMRLSIGGATLELSEPCAPCGKIGESFVGRRFSRIDHNMEEGWSRWLARVVEVGAVSVGDTVDMIITPS